MDLSSWQDQARLFLSEKTAKLEGAVISETLLEQALRRLDSNSFTDNLTRNYWFVSSRDFVQQVPKTFILRPDGKLTGTDRALLECLTSSSISSAVVRHDCNDGLEAKAYKPSVATQHWHRLEKVIEDFEGKTGDGTLAFKPERNTVKPKRALTVLSLSRFAENAERLLLERCFANYWLSRSFDFVFDIDFFSQTRSGLCAIEVKQKDPISGRSPLEVGINYGEARLLSRLSDAGIEIFLFYLIKPYIRGRDNKSKPLALLYDTALIGQSCWLAARFPKDILQTQETATAGPHTSLTGGNKMSYFSLTLSEHFCRLSPDRGCSGGLEICPRRLSAFLDHQLPKVSDDDILDRWVRDC
jgi:hypothetical protein